MDSSNTHKSVQKSWKLLEEHQREIEKTQMRDMFEADPDRYETFSIEFGDVFVDYSKHRITRDTIDLLLSLATESRITDAIEQQFTGHNVNTTEKRPALHTALRSPANKPIYINDNDISAEIHNELKRIGDFVRKLHVGEIKGHSGKSINTLINIGIGGSDLGPRLVVHALKPYSDPTVTVRFVSNIDATDINHSLGLSDPETTLICISSKSFTTKETIVNATTAKQWLEAHGCRDISKHFVAVSANKAATEQFGITQNSFFEIWDWAGGRYSLWSAIGLPIAASVGMDNFQELLAGAHDMDQHFRKASLKENIPIILAMLDIWYINFFNTETLAIIPYDESLSYLPAYLGQLIMESNGKNITHEGTEVHCHTAPVIWGGTGTNVQHTFFQLLHQGTHLVPVEFLVSLNSPCSNEEHHKMLFANCLAQSEALTMGSPGDNQQQESFKNTPGNKPSTTILYKELTPRILGTLLAMYEHRTMVQGHIWNIDSFDQWGVQLGKTLADSITNELHGSDSTELHDTSTQNLIARFKNRNKK